MEDSLEEVIEKQKPKGIVYVIFPKGVRRPFSTDSKGSVKTQKQEISEHS